MPRPRRGDRIFTGTRLAPGLRAALEDAQRTEGYRYLGDYIAAILAGHVGLPDYAPAPDITTTDEELPMTG